MTEIETLKDTKEIKEVKKMGRPIKPDSVHHDVEKLKEYKRQYYHQQQKGEFICPSCQKMMLSKSSLTRHIKMNRRECEFVKMKKTTTITWSNHCKYIYLSIYKYGIYHIYI